MLGGNIVSSVEKPTVHMLRGGDECIAYVIMTGIMLQTKEHEGSASVILFCFEKIVCVVCASAAAILSC